VELILFWLLSRLGGPSKPSYQALQGPETYKEPRIVTPELVREAHERGLLGYGVDGITTDRADILAKVFNGE
jgi:hypothetical protein